MYIQIPDDLAQRLTTVADAQRTSIHDLCSRVLLRFGTVPPGVRSVIVTGEDLQALERQLAGGFLQDGADLVQRMERWAGITIGGIRLHFTEAQLEEIGHRAHVQGRSPEQIVQELVEQIEQDLFYRPVVAR